MRFDTPEDINKNAAIVYYAYEQGINYFDTAPGYCGDHSEDIMGAAIKQMKPGTFYISTKCGAVDGDALRKSLEKSLRRLNVDTINFFHIWCVITTEEWERRKSGGSVDAAFKAKDEGLIEHVVMSTHMTGDEISSVVQEDLFDGYTIGYCAINFPYRQKGIDAIAAAGKGVITMNPLGGGLIPQNAERFDFIRSEGDPSVVSAAIRFNVSQPAITSALVGCTTKEHVDEAVAAVEDFKPYDASHIETVRRKIEDGFDDLCTGCCYCEPCEHGVPVSKLMEAYNHKILSGDNDQAIINRLNWHWGLTVSEASKCVECGSCEDACTQRLPITGRLSHMSSLEQ